MSNEKVITLIILFCIFLITNVWGDNKNSNGKEDLQGGQPSSTPYKGTIKNDVLKPSSTTPYKGTIKNDVLKPSSTPFKGTIKNEVIQPSSTPFKGTIKNDVLKPSSAPFKGTIKDEGGKGK